MRRHLGYCWDEWTSLPWQQQRAYTEGLMRELYDLTPAADASAMSTWMDAGITFN